jgi:RNA polymerase sigma factor (TIGR02999 family)
MSYGVGEHHGQHPFARFGCSVNAQADITALLKGAVQGNAPAMEQLMPKVYESLRRLARRQRVGEAAHTLQTTALVHEAYLVLMNQQATTFEDRAHFFAYASQVMRHLLVDHARRRLALKRQVPAEDSGLPDHAPGEAIIDVLALDQALDRLAAIDARLARVAELKLFAELGSAAVGELLGVNSRTVERDWLKARTFLSGCLLPP